MAVAVKNTYKGVWEELEAGSPQPRFLGKVHEVDFVEFERQIREQKTTFVEQVVESLYAGDFYIVKRAFSKDFVSKLRNGVHDYWSNQPESFHKMLEGAPDFHRVIDEEVAKKYSFKQVKHAAYFFPWNDDPVGLFPVIMPRWRPLKFLGGVKWDEYENNTPRDGVVDRIQVVRYLPKVGTLETHSDPFKHQRMFISGYLSKRGVDFEGGGFYAVGERDDRIYLEDELDTGDMGIGYATVLHGVAPCDVDKVPDVSKTDGRWFLGLYSNASDAVKDRHTGYAVSIDKADA